MAWLIGIITGIIAGVVSSIIFFIVIGLIKPKVEIAEDISLDRQTNIYKIKAVNHSRSMLTNVKYLLLYQNDNGQGVTSVQEILPIKDSLQYIDAYSGKRNYCDYAVRISYYFNEQTHPLDANHKLVFIIFAEHSRSNKSKCYKQVYTKSQIKEGTFETGKSTRVIRN